MKEGAVNFAPILGLRELMGRTSASVGNGNRLKHITPAGETVGVYDDQDRLLSYGATTYTYGENGELQTPGSLHLRQC